MKAAFFFDTVLYKDNNDFFGMTLTYDFFKKRYLKYFKSLEVCTRVKNISEAKGDIKGYKKSNGNNVIISPIIEYNDIPDAIIRNKKIEKHIEKIVLENDFMIIRMPSVLGMIACKICKLHKKKYMIEMVACAWDGYMNHTRFGGKLLAPFMFVSTRSCVKHAPYVLYVTQKFLQKRYPTKGLSIGCSDVEINFDDNTILQKRREKISSFNKHNLSLCTVGNVEMKYKGHIYVLKMIKMLKKEGYNFKYYLAGNGNQNYLKKILKKYKLENDVIFLGSLNHERVFKLLDYIDVYIQPSMQEGLPRALVEAMSRGCPAIGTNAGGIPELLDSNMIFKKGKYKQLVKIVRTLTMEKLLLEIQCNYHKSSNYSAAVLNKKRDDFYAQIMEGVN